MRVLFVIPSELSLGEAITALHIADRVERRGGRCVCLASPFAARFLEPRLGDRVTRMGADARLNRGAWERSLQTLRPHAVVFADYPLLFFSNSIAPLADERWVASLDELDALPVTLDHLGLAQRARCVFFGPPHLSMHGEATPELPARMRVLLPCPLQAPDAVAGRRGTPFRYWDLPLAATDGERSAWRRRHLDDEASFLVVHTTPNWAWRIARDWQLPHYAFVSEILESYLADLPAPVTVISVNNGELLPPSGNARVRIRNSGVLPPGEYERLLAAADLVITDNAVSSAAGRAACALRPVAVLHNPRRLADIVADAEPGPRRIALAMERARLGSVFPFEVFPIWGAAELEELGLFRENPVEAAMPRVDLFGGESSRRRLHALLTDRDTCAALRARQCAYVERLAELPDPFEALTALMEAERA
jgi:hypothetical protein